METLSLPEDTAVKAEENPEVGLLLLAVHAMHQAHYAKSEVISPVEQLHGHPELECEGQEVVQQREAPRQVL